jgi:hypothetical protein
LRTPSLFAIGKQATSKNARRGMAAAESLLEFLGKALVGAVRKQARQNMTMTFIPEWLQWQ